MPNQKWTVEIEVSDWLVGDGLDLTDRVVQDAMARAFPYALGSEVKCKVVARPPDEVIAGMQGFPSVAAYVRDRDGSDDTRVAEVG
jgi:cytidylate kinase